MIVTTYFSPLGPLKIQQENNFITQIKWDQTIYQGTSNLLTEVFHQLDAYFKGQLTHFDFPYQLNVSPFKRKVYQQMYQIPYGQTGFYHQLGPAQAVGQACKNNPLVILIPCHRVVAVHGPGGYNGGLNTKLALLNLEGFVHGYTYPHCD